MKRKYEEKQDSGSKLDPKTTGLPAQFKLKPHHQKKHKSGDLDKEKDASQSKLDLLPLDLKLDILTRLPAKTLKSFRCVSKMWSSIIRNRDFVRSFFSVSSTRPRLILALSNGISNVAAERLVFFFSFSEHDENKSSSLLPSFEMAMSSVGFCGYSGSCTTIHGLLAAETSTELRICNPSTEQFIKLPDITGTKYVGYDPINHQYKALALSYYTNPYQINAHVTLLHKVFTLGQDTEWRLIQPPTTSSYTHIQSLAVSIDGFIYYGAYSPSSPTNPGIVCFDVRSEKLTYIKAPPPILYQEELGTFLEYKGKLASIVVAKPHSTFNRFDLWILEDAAKHEWSRKTCLVPRRVWAVVGGDSLFFPGTNKIGEIIMAPKLLSSNVRPFYIFYYNVETQKIRCVRLQGIGDNQEFRRSYGFVDKSECHVRIAPQHIESIDFF